MSESSSHADFSFLLKVLPLPVLTLPAPLITGTGGPYFKLRGHPDELPGVVCDTPATHQSGPEKAV